MNLPDRILLSRTDRIGDVLLCFPVAAFLKQIKPGIFIGFLGTSYTEALIRHCPHIDRYEDREAFLALDSAPDYDAVIHLFPDREVARKAARLRIPVRVGIRNKIRLWRRFTHSILLSRRRSDLHEAELNLQLLRVFDVGRLPVFSEIREMPLLNPAGTVLQKERKRVILHPFSSGSAREWPLFRYTELVHLLQRRHFDVYVSGSAAEKEKIEAWIARDQLDVVNLSGKGNLQILISDISEADVLVACSTGPLHIAAAMGKITVGIYSPMRPIFARRWGPAGPYARALSAGTTCRYCRRNPEKCLCMQQIDAQAVFCEIKNLLAEKYEKENNAARERRTG